MVTELICAWEQPLPSTASPWDIFWWNYGSEQAGQQLPWRNSPDRAHYLYAVAERAVRLRRIRTEQMVAD